MNCQQWTGQTSKVKVKLDPKVPNIWELALELHTIPPQKKSNLEQKVMLKMVNNPST